ncbi:ankyrin repeat domain-containing protein 45 [Boleophthalmus pectinirostris]|uniref:ankyrin repeat domain-containing protein 45 n=1 Tax=Boleophthalmus pectinirostris TaxID=150288 RepID=UPI00242CFCF9|nr:ankyrin repeat domain-containing protein 45 [Boleophthalmus pectinirostris]
MTPEQEDLFASVFRGDTESLRRRLQDVEPEQIENLLSGSDEVGRSALIVGGLLGRTAAVTELTTYGAQVNQQTERGYTALHLASCWGHVDTVQTLLKLGADPKVQNFRGECPVDLARKYSRIDCEKCLILGEAKQDFASYLAHIKGVISESAASLTKDERNLSSHVLAAKTEWLQTVTDPQVSDFTDQRRSLDDSLQHIFNKLNLRT